MKDVAVKNNPLPAAITPMEMISKALENGATPEALEKMLSLQERWEAREAKKAYDAAMSEFQNNPPAILKNAQGQNSKYAKLDAITRAVSPVMANLGLSFTWRTGTVDKTVSVTCVISHKAGHREETTLKAEPDLSGKKNAIQGIGSAVTYLQRYTLMAALGLAASEDDDGSAAGSRLGEFVSNEDIENITYQAAQANLNTVKICEAYGVESLSMLPKGKLSSVLNRIKKTKEANNG